MIALKSWPLGISLPADISALLSDSVDEDQQRVDLPCISISPKSPKRVLTPLSMAVLSVLLEAGLP